MKKPASFYDFEPPIYGRDRKNAFGLWLFFQMSMSHLAQERGGPFTVSMLGNTITIRRADSSTAMKIWFRPQSGTAIAAFASGEALHLRMIETCMSIGEDLFSSTDLAAIALLELVRAVEEGE
jgi:hypothetical protein